MPETNTETSSEQLQSFVNNIQYSARQCLVQRGSSGGYDGQTRCPTQTAEKYGFKDGVYYSFGLSLSGLKEKLGFAILNRDDLVEITGLDNNKKTFPVKPHLIITHTKWGDKKIVAWDFCNNVPDVYNNRGSEIQFTVLFEEDMGNKLEDEMIDGKIDPLAFLQQAYTANFSAENDSQKLWVKELDWIPIFIVNSNEDRTKVSPRWVDGKNRRIKTWVWAQDTDKPYYI